MQQPTFTPPESDHDFDEPRAERPGRRKELPELDGFAASRVAAVLSRLSVNQPVLLSYNATRTNIRARVAQMVYRGLIVAIREFVPPATRVHAVFESGMALRGDIMRCRPHGAEFLADLKLFDARMEWAGEDGRTGQRFPVEIAGALNLDGSAYGIVIVDISSTGLRVRCPRRIQPGSQVEVISLRAIIQGEVRYCREVSEDEFYLGIQADPATSRVSGQSGDLDLTALRDA
jgi:hypothetical protein